MVFLRSGTCCWLAAEDVRLRSTAYSRRMTNDRTTAYSRRTVNDIMEVLLACGRRHATEDMRLRLTAYSRRMAHDKMELYLTGTNCEDGND
jgi:hypothetical protein